MEKSSILSFSYFNTAFSIIWDLSHFQQCLHSWPQTGVHWRTITNLLSLLKVTYWPPSPLYISAITLKMMTVMMSSMLMEAVMTTDDDKEEQNTNFQLTKINCSNLQHRPIATFTKQRHYFNSKFARISVFHKNPKLVWTQFWIHFPDWKEEDDKWEWQCRRWWLQGLSPILT